MACLLNGPRTGEGELRATTAQLRPQVVIVHDHRHDRTILRPCLRIGMTQRARLPRTQRTSGVRTYASVAGHLVRRHISQCPTRLTAPRRADLGLLRAASQGAPRSGNRGGA